MHVLDQTVDIPERCAVLFIVDGMSQTVADRMIRAGQLPHIERIFLNGGVRVDRATASLPSVTYANTTSLITGLFPSHHHIMGNQWFDPTTLDWQDYSHASTYTDVNDDFDSPTLYDILSDEFTVNVHGHTHRGVTWSIMHRMKNGMDWLFGQYTDVDRRAGQSVARIAMHANRSQRWPGITTLYFPGVDEIGHRYGPTSIQYTDALSVVDGAIGRVMADLRSMGIYERVHFVLTSDHGMSALAPERYVDIASWLSTHCGWRVCQRTPLGYKIFGAAQSLKSYDAIAVLNGGRCAQIHVKSQHGWGHQMQPNDIELAMRALMHGHGALSKRGMTDDALLMCARIDQDRFLMQAGVQRFYVDRNTNNGGCEYHIEMPGDEWDQIRDHPLLSLLVHDAMEHTTVMHGEKSVQSQGWSLSPLGRQVVTMFDSARSGDIVIFAGPGVSFHPTWLGGHGSILDVDRIVPLYFTGPGWVKGARIPIARTVDIMPTLLELMNESQRMDHVSIDGKSIADGLRAARAP